MGNGFYCACIWDGFTVWGIGFTLWRINVLYVDGFIVLWGMTFTVWGMGFTLWGMKMYGELYNGVFSST